MAIKLKNDMFLRDCFSLHLKPYLKFNRKLCVYTHLFAYEYKDAISNY